MSIFSQTPILGLLKRVSLALFLLVSASTHTATKSASQKVSKDVIRKTLKIINPVEDIKFTAENSNKLICATTYFSRYRD